MRNVRRVLGLGALVLVLSAGCCNDCEPPPPEPKSLTVVPHSVTVSPPPNDTATFELEAVVQAASGGMIAESWGHKLRWALTGGGSPVDTIRTLRHRATIRVAGAGAGSVVVTASAEIVDTAQSAPSAVISVNPAPPVADIVMGRYDAGSRPAVALINGKPGGGEHCVGLAIAFVRVAPIGDLAAPCEPASRVVVFSADRAMALRAVGWFPAVDTVDVVADQLPPDTVPVAVHVAVALWPDETISRDSLRRATRAYALADVDQTNALLRLNRTGIVLEIHAAVPDILPGGLEKYDCGAFTASSGVLNVFYVNRIVNDAIAQYCPPTNAHPEGAIYLSRGYHTATLAHEVGHALALLFPAAGHTDRIRDFTAVNIMRSGPTDAAYADRWHFSLGQIFRMSAAQRSWINHSVGGADPIRKGRPTMDCQCDPYERNPCPGLAEDVTLVLTSGPPLDKAECYDRIHLGATVLSDTAVALLTGRPWSTEACETGLPGRPYRVHAEARLRLFFPNVVSAADCPSRLTVFFQHRALMVRDIPQGQWTAEFDALPSVDDLPGPPRTVPVHIWLPSGNEEWSDDQALANEVFGGRIGTRSNLTGIRLQWTPQSLGGWDARQLLDALRLNACVAPTSLAQFIKKDSINVYYIAPDALLTADGGFTCRPSAGSTYFIFLSGPAGPALPHHLGHALSLRDVAAEDGLQPANVMWREPSNRGLELALGQVFRMNLDARSWLQMVGGTLPKLECDDCDADKCPALSVDFREPVE